MMGLQHTTFFFLLLFGLSTENRGDHHAPPPQLRLTDGYSALLGDPRAQAESGDADAQFKLGMIYRSGLPTIPRNPRIAARWLQRAAAQGVAAGKHEWSFRNIETGYDDGLRLPLEETTTVRAVREAALQGSPGAQTNLAYM